MLMVMVYILTMSSAGMSWGHFKLNAIRRPATGSIMTRDYHGFLLQSSGVPFDSFHTFVSTGERQVKRYYKLVV